jgi:hypothetical protein
MSRFDLLWYIAGWQKKKRGRSWQSTLIISEIIGRVLEFMKVRSFEGYSSS